MCQAGLRIPAAHRVNSSYRFMALPASNAVGLDADERRNLSITRPTSVVRGLPIS